MSWRRISTVYRKDVRDARRDARLFAALLVPVVLGLLYSVAFEDDSRPKATLGYVSAAASTLPQAVKAAAEDAVIVELRGVADEERLKALIEGEDVDVGLVIPTGFDAELTAGEAPALTVVLPATPSVGGDYVAALVEPVTRDLAGHRPAVAITRVSLQPAPGSTAAALEILGPRRLFILISVMLMLVMIASYALPTTVTEENEKKTLEALTLIASHWEVIAGKTLLGLTYCVVLIPLMLVVTNQRPADPALFVTAMGASSIALVGMGLLFGGMFTTQSQLNSWSALPMLVLMAPVFTVGLPTPSWVNATVYALPTAQTMRLGVNAMAGRAVFGDVWLSLLILAAWALVAYGLVWWRLARHEAA